MLDEARQQSEQMIEQAEQDAEQQVREAKQTLPEWIAAERVFRAESPSEVIQVLRESDYG